MKPKDIEQVRIELTIPGLDPNAGRYIQDNGESRIVYIGAPSWSIVTSDDTLIDYLDRRTSALSSVGGAMPLALRLADNERMLEDIVQDELSHAEERIDRHTDKKFDELVEEVVAAEVTQDSMTLDSTSGRMKPQTVGKIQDGLILSVSTEHQVHILRLDGEEIEVEEIWHDGSHKCTKRMNVRKLTHLLCNLTDGEIQNIITRDDDALKVLSGEKTDAIEIHTSNPGKQGVVAGKLETSEGQTIQVMAKEGESTDEAMDRVQDNHPGSSVA
jgi:hypothetical protein